jgi:hypothetical protein
VRKLTVIPVFTEANLVWIIVAKLGFVFVAMVKTLNSVVGPPASVMLRIFLGFCKFAKLWGVLAVLSPVILDAVEEEATLMVVGASPVRTFIALKITQE